MMSISWSIDPAQYLAAHTRAITDSIEADIVALVESLLDEVEQYMRQEARWQDRTGAARQALYTDIEHAARQSVTLLMAHGPDISYGWYLETVNSGRYEILSSTSDHWWPVLYRGAVEILRRHSG